MTTDGPTLTDALLRPILEADAARPLVTYYDDASGERIELSGTTLANWAAKTANMLSGELGVTPGDPVAVLLPAHWQTVAVYLGVWWCGGVAVGETGAAEVALCTADRLAEAEAAAEVAALSLDAFGRGVDDLPLGVTDFATSVRLHGDVFTPTPMPHDAPALGERTFGEVLGAARASAGSQGLTAQDRVLSSRDWGTPVQLTDGLLAVLAAGASLVQVAHPDEALITRRIETERVTRQW